MPALGQTEKNSVRANVARFAPKSGPCSMRSTLRRWARSGCEQMRELASRRSSAYTVEALLDRCEALVDERFVLSIGENVGPVVFDGLANQFAHSAAAMWWPSRSRAERTCSVAAQRNVEMQSGTASRFWLVKTKELADLILGS